MNEPNELIISMSVFSLFVIFGSNIAIGTPKQQFVNYCKTEILEIQCALMCQLIDSTIQKRHFKFNLFVLINNGTNCTSRTKLNTVHTNSKCVATYQFVINVFNCLKYIAQLLKRNLLHH